MPDYQNGKIYKIVDNTNGNIYVGSTTQRNLKVRLQKHRGHYREYIKGKREFMKSYDIIKNSDYYIELIEIFPCLNNKELCCREQYWIDNIDCINQTRAYTDYREYQRLYQTQYRNTSKSKEYMKNWRMKNYEYRKTWGDSYTNLLLINPFLFQ